MSLRYVWDKSTFEYYASQKFSGSSNANYPSGSVDIYYSSSYSTNFSKADCFTLSSPKYKTIEEGVSVTIPAGSYFAKNTSSAELSYTPDELEIEWVSGKSYYYFPYPYKVTKEARAVDFISKVSASSSSQYPTGGVSGDYYYARLGSDTIDAASVTIGTEVSGDNPVVVTVTPSASNSYGGTITYKYDYTVDGGATWTNYATTTATSVEIPIPENAATFKARVLASDDMGFTSADYVQSELATVVWNTAPTIPATITVPTIKSGKQATITWSESTDEDGNLTGYQLQRQINGGSWQTIYTGSKTTFDDTPSASWTTVAYRVAAYDDKAAYSDYKTSNTITVVHNNDPVISGSDTDLGSFGMTKPSVFNYVVTDEDGDTVTITEKIDGKIKRSYTATLGATNAFQFTDEEWLKILNGSHTATITADDGNGGVVTRTLTFTKSVTKIQFYLTTPLESAEMATKALENVTRVIPDGAIFKVEVCNNGFDASPTWEDVTQRVLDGAKIFLSNTTKTATKWGFNIRVTIDRNGKTGDCYVTGGAGFFE